MWATERFGEAISETSIKHFRACRIYPGGLLIGWENNADRACVQLDGEACSRLTLTQVAEVINDLHGIGYTATRVDTCIDFVDQDIGCLTDKVRDACKRGELCGFKRDRGAPEYHTPTGERVGDTHYLGKRGSPKFIRIYDKGLESSLLPGGVWYRWETQWGDELAAQAAQAVRVQGLARFGDKAIGDRIHQLAIRAADFRVPELDANGDMVRKSRRETSPWFEELCMDTGPLVMHRAPRPDPELQSFGKWGLDSKWALRIIEMSQRTGESLEMVFYNLFGRLDLEMDLDEPSTSQVVLEYLDRFGKHR